MNTTGGVSSMDVVDETNLMDATEGDFNSITTAISSEAASILDELKPTIISVIETTGEETEKLKKQVFNSTIAQKVPQLVQQIPQYIHNTSIRVAVDVQSFANESITVIENAVSEVENSTTSLWTSISNGISTGVSSVGNFFTSSWNKVVSWWNELEDEVKEVIHITIKIVDVMLGIAAVSFLIWGYIKIQKAYGFVLGSA